ncbi:hypothetical protein BDN71DRAFT_1505718 [Pleurotus eryngii]|uniref:CxC6 like cysteine cluster associated with KDZ domain-containing protein n=1 Tax=Pleurotus eryngii TaxID=5323 RepID=A0A9P6DGA0_PLEER|nr:hypothetical protein BDN71DRAFT_1505718 [Pleurotus eryngii]
MVMACPTLTCNKHSLTQELHEQDTSQVTLLQGSQCFENVPVLAGHCSICRTLYWADHERFTQDNGDDVCLYLNDAKYLKVGKSVWVDHLVSRAIVNTNYSFHASTAAITEFWHFSFVQPSRGTFKLSHCQVWKAFVAESICHMASIDNRKIVFKSNLSINALVAAAYAELGDGGIVCSAVGHSCDECCHAFKDVMGVIPRQPDDPAAVVGHNENHVVPDYEGPALDPDAMEVEKNPAGPVGLGNIAADVRMVVIDGIVMGPHHCAMQGCVKALLNAQTEVFCEEREEAMAGRCWMKNCDQDKIGDTQACQEHQPQWARFCRQYANTLLLGIQQMLRRAQKERQPWLPCAGEEEALEHDDLEEQENEEVSGTKYNNYFSASRFYCVETLCAPYGVVIAWHKFAKAEGVAKILQFFEDIYSNTHFCPSYIAIDKGCALLKHIVKQGHWHAWEPTTWIIVDSYHYINHQTTDHLCQTWCNPAPLNGDAPNLVMVANNKQGNPYYKRAFNTQACEQLNAWIGGFQTVLNQMTVNNFDFTMHVLLFLHTEHVIAKQKERQRKQAAGIEVVAESEDEG